MKAWAAGWLLAVAVCLALGTVVAAGAETGAEKSDGTAPTEEAPEAKAPPKPHEIPEAERTRIDKQIAEARAKLQELDGESMELGIKVLEAQTKALDGVEDQKKLNNALAKGILTKDVVQYRNIFLACAQQWQMMESKYTAIHRGLRYLEQKREEMPEDLKTSVNDLLATILKQRRNCFEKIAAIYEKLLDDKKTLAVYVTIYQMLPEDQREADTTLKNKILTLNKKIEDANKSSTEKGAADWKKPPIKR